MLLNLFSERHNGIDALLPAYERKPAMARGDVRHLVRVDDLKRAHALVVTLSPELRDRRRVDVEPARFVYEMHDCESGA